MGLESTTYLNGLTSAWPIGSDPKSQGDDHIRLVKGALQATFPVATMPFYFPRSLGFAANVTTDEFYQNSTIYINTASGDITVTLPTLATPRGGWFCDVVKSSGDANVVSVVPSSGTILTQAGAMTSVKVGALAMPVRFVWLDSGTWLAVRTGPIIGSSMNWDAAAVPLGWLSQDGSAFNTTRYNELFAVLGTGTLRDKRGRVEAGVDGAGRLTGVVGSTPGSTGGGSSQTLVTGNLPPYTPAGSVTLSLTGAVSIHSALSNVLGGGVNIMLPGAPDTSVSFAGSSASFSGTPQGGGSTPLPIVQPTIITQKLIRAC